MGEVVDLGRGASLVVGHVDLATIHPDLTLERTWAYRPDAALVVRTPAGPRPIPRRAQAYGRDFAFSGQTAPAAPLPPELAAARDWAACATGTAYNGLLVNWYADGSEYIGPHADNTTALVPGSHILTLTLGAGRRFRVRDRESGKPVTTITLADGDWVAMCGTMQEHFTHEIVKTTIPTGPRISVTMRQFA